MNIYVEVEEGVVINSYNYVDGEYPEGLIKAPHDGIIGWSYDGESFSEPQIPLFKLREIRNNLLRDSDWSQLPDSALSEEDVASWVAYRQALRDITIDYISTANPSFPLPPNHPTE